MMTPSRPIHPVHTRKSAIGKLAGLQGRVGVMASSLSTFRAASGCTRKRRPHHKQKHQQLVALNTRTTSDSSHNRQGSEPRRKEDGSSSRTKAQTLTRPAPATDKTTTFAPKRAGSSNRAKAQTLMRHPGPATDKTPPPPAQQHPPKRASSSSSPPPSLTRNPRLLSP
jgi:hypothetical protein